MYIFTLFALHVMHLYCACGILGL